MSQLTSRILQHDASTEIRCSTSNPWSYELLKRATLDQRLPLVLVDLERFDRNCRDFIQKAKSAGKRIRIASKSIRVPALIQRVLDHGSAVSGVMCYSVAEAVFLAELGFDDLLIAYPTTEQAEIALVKQAVQAGKTITLMADCPEHLAKLSEAWRFSGGRSPLRICIEIDVSWRPWGQHFGSQRSPIRSVLDLKSLLDCLGNFPNLQMVGAMAYEAHLSGVPDANPFTPVRNLAVRTMRHFASRDVAKKRQKIHECLRSQRLELEFFNGGGTGWFEPPLAESCLTEVTVGSGLLQPHLFDYYRGQTRLPAFCFALPVTRISQNDRITCQGGGFIASGPPNPDRPPQPIFPLGLGVEPQEGFGEVQTPLIVPRSKRGQIKLGDPIFFRPAKAGEIAERFTEYCLLSQDRIVNQVPTYRGMNQCFH